MKKYISNLVQNPSGEIYNTLLAADVWKLQEIGIFHVCSNMSPDIKLTNCVLLSFSTLYILGK